MANIKFTNMASSTVQAAVTTTSTTVTVLADDISKFPSISDDEYFMIVLVNGAGDFEIMKVRGITDNTFSVIRAQEGTSVKTFAIGDKVEHRLTAESLVNIVEEASTTKPHTATDADTYGHATSTLFSHIKITDDTTSSAASVLGIGISPYAVKTRFEQIVGMSAQQVITASGNFTVPETGTYEVTCIGGGGNGGNGGGADDGARHYDDVNRTYYYIASGGGGGGGGAGQTIVQQVALTKGDVIPVVVGSSGGQSKFGTTITALAGANGSVGGNASGCGCSCGNIVDYYYDGPGSGGAGGYSYGSLAATGSAGSGGTIGYVSFSGGNGGAGGISTEGTYGNGGTGGRGQGVTNNADGCAVSYGAVGLGAVGTQGCVKIRLVLGH